MFNTQHNFVGPFQKSRTKQEIRKAPFINSSNFWSGRNLKQLILMTKLYPKSGKKTMFALLNIQKTCTYFEQFCQYHSAKITVNLWNPLEFLFPAILLSIHCVAIFGRNYWMHSRLRTMIYSVVSPFIFILLWLMWSNKSEGIEVKNAHSCKHEFKCTPYVLI